MPSPDIHESSNFTKRAKNFPDVATDNIKSHTVSITQAIINHTQWQSYTGDIKSYTLSIRKAILYHTQYQSILNPTQYRAPRNLRFCATQFLRISFIFVQWHKV